MNKLILLSAPALLAACTLVLPLYAAVPQGSGSVDGNAAVGADKAVSQPSVRPKQGTVTGDLNSDVSADQSGVQSQEKLNASISADRDRRADARLRNDYRGYSGRLRSVEARIDAAEKAGRYNADQARRHRDEIRKIRARFRKTSDKDGSRLSASQKAELEADVKDREETMSEVDSK